MKLTVDFSENSRVYTHFPSSASRMLFYYPLMVGYEECGPQFFLERNDYEDYLILYTISGSGHLKYRSKEYSITPNSCMFISCNEYHTYRNTGKEPWIITWMHFNGNNVKQYFDVIYSLAGPVLKLEDLTCVPTNIGEIINLVKTSNSSTDIRASLLITEILSEFLTVIKYGLNENEISVDVMKAINYIDNHYYLEDISLDKVAAEIAISKFYLSHIFKKSTGLSVNEYIIQCKLREGKRLLISTNIQISDIADNLGFSTPSNFTRLFKQKVGYTPLQYRKSRNKETETQEIKYSKDMRNKTLNF